MSKDPSEWDNLAADPQCADVKRELAQWLPKVDKRPVPGSAGRVLTYDPKTGVVVCEGMPIDKQSPLPEF
jgi:hypothetical protein